MVVGFGVGTFLVWVWVLVNFGRPWRGHYITLETPHLGPRKLLMEIWCSNFCAGRVLIEHRQKSTRARPNCLSYGTTQSVSSVLVNYQWICHHVVEMSNYWYAVLDMLIGGAINILVMQQRNEFLQPLVAFITTALKPYKKSRTHWEALPVLARVTGIH